MKSTRTLALFLIAATTLSGPQARAFNPVRSSPPPRVEHVVQKGENLWALALQYDLSVQSIREANRLPKGTEPAVGARLAIPIDPVLAAKLGFAPYRSAIKTADDPTKKASLSSKESGKALADEDDETTPRDPRLKLGDEDEPDGSSILTDSSRDALGAQAAGRSIKTRLDPADLEAPGELDETANDPDGSRATRSSSRGRSRTADRKRQEESGLRTGCGDGWFAWPIRGPLLSAFGKRRRRMHTGIDLKASTGTPIHATRAGRVLFSGVVRGHGRVIVLDHGDGYCSVYSHNKKNLVRTGDNERVEAGQVIATVGRSGNASTSHLHFEIRWQEDPVNPLTLLNGGLSAREVPRRHRVRF